MPLQVGIGTVAIQKAYRPSRRLWVGIALVVRTVLMLFLSTGIVQERIAEGESDVDGLTVGNFETSLRVRILMGQMALGTGLQAPLLGQGFSGYLRKVDELLEKERIPPIMAFFKTEPHSDFLCVFASRGLLGVIAFGALLIFPLAYFLASLTRGDARRVASAHSGLTLIIVLAIAGFSITMIDQRAMICFLAVMVAITLYLSWASGSTRCIGIVSR